MLNGQNLNDKNVLIDVDYYRRLVQNLISLVSDKIFERASRVQLFEENRLLLCAGTVLYTNILP